MDLRQDDKKKNAFSTAQRQWQFTVMLFRLRNAPATFEQLIETILRARTCESLNSMIVMGCKF
jgi:hypothetical protein